MLNNEYFWNGFFVFWALVTLTVTVARPNRYPNCQTAFVAIWKAYLLPAIIQMAIIGIVALGMGGAIIAQTHGNPIKPLIALSYLTIVGQAGICVGYIRNFYQPKTDRLQDIGQ